MERGDEPKFHLEVLPPFLNPNKLEDIVVIHLRQVVDLLLRVPRVLVLQRKDLDGHHVVAELALPDGSEPASGLDLHQFDISLSHVEVRRRIFVAD